MIRRVAVVPNPPLLVPELVPGAVAETAGVRDAVVEAAAWLTETSARWLAVGVGDAAASHPDAVSHTVEASARGSFAGFGVDVPVALAADPSTPPTPRQPATPLAQPKPQSPGLPRTPQASPTVQSPGLPLSVLIAGWLRARAGAASVRVDVVSSSLPADECRSLGQRLDDGEDTVLLVLGDGSNRHGERAPARPDARAADFDAGIAAALATADAAALAAVDPQLASELGATGRAAWQVAAGVLGDGRWAGKLLYSDAPFGVAYHVATWERT